jgi:hypothetical protein
MNFSPHILIKIQLEVIIFSRKQVMSFGEMFTVNGDIVVGMLANSEAVSFSQPPVADFTGLLYFYQKLFNQFSHLNFSFAPPDLPLTTYR